ncbi:MAG: hypothetical protein LBL66_04330, partial [Clostridiales bacterium]|nr:hypothetical protein [Clostridiales bacterium]
MDTTQGNDRRDGWLSKDGVITAENVRRKGEYTAICAVKGRLGYEASRFMQETYRNLIRDMDHFDDKGYALTDSYDIAQEAIGFLCGYIGRKLTDTV